MARNLIGSLRVALGLDSAKFERGAKRTQSTVRQMRSQFIAVAGAAALFGGALAALGRRSADTIDRQSKLAQSLNTTTGSVQILERAASLAGVSMSEAGEGAARLTRRISLAAQGTGPAVKAFERLGLNLEDLMQDDVVTRIAKVQDAIQRMIPEVERAGVLSQVFGDRAFVAFQRLDPGTLQDAADELRRFGVIVSDVDADRIEASNDALTRLGLIAQGFGNQIAVSLAPALEGMADALGDLFAVTGPFGRALRVVGEQIGRIAAIGAAAVGVFGVRLAGAMVAARIATFSLAGALTVLRGALLRTGLGVIIVGVGEVIYQFTRLVTSTGGVGEAFKLLGEVASGVWDGIKTSAMSIVPALNAVWAQVQASFFILMERLTAKWRDFLLTVASTTAKLPGGDGLAGDLFQAAAKADAAVTNFIRSSADAEAAAIRLRLESEQLRVEGFDRAAVAAGKLAAAVKGTADASEDGRDSLGALQDAINGAADAAGGAGGAMRALTPEVEETRNAFEQIGPAAASTFSAIIRGAESARDAVSGLLDRLADMELVSLPRGSRIYDAGRSVQMTQGGGAAPVNISIDARGAVAGVGAEVDAALARRLPDIRRMAVASVKDAGMRGM